MLNEISPTPYLPTTAPYLAAGPRHGLFEGGVGGEAEGVDEALAAAHEVVGADELVPVERTPQPHTGTWRIREWLIINHHVTLVM